MNPKIAATRVSLLLLLFTLCAVTALAQTPSFTYQGRLSDGGTAASGTYDLQFTLWDALSGGTQQPQPAPLTVTRTSVLVTGGIFTVPLDFGATAFPGADRFLEISARLTGAPTFITLAPRQQITSTPYAIRSLNASSADAVTVSGVPGGSGNYVQNATTPQASANFNISGTGTANILNAAAQYNIGGNRVLSVAGTENVFAGVGAGGSNSTGIENSFFGLGAGQANTTGSRNSFFGRSAGKANTDGRQNSFFGRSAGDRNTTGIANSFFGSFTGSSNTTGDQNSFFGASAGANNTGSYNSFFGVSAGAGEGPGQGNSFFGNGAGSDNMTGSFLTAMGIDASFGTSNLINATALGANAQVDQNNSLVLGSIAGINKATASVNVGIGTTTPATALEVSGNVRSTRTGVAPQYIQLNGGDSGSIKLTAQSTVAAEKILFIQNLSGDASPGVNNVIQFQLGTTASPSTKMTIDKTGSVGIGTLTPFLNTKLDIVGGLLRLDQLAGGGDEALCRNSQAHTIAACSSSLRYKEQIAPYNAGLELINRLRPISFAWKAGGRRDLGLGAEDVAKVEPLLVTRNDKGEIEGVKYDHLNVVLINAIKQQQDQIETLRVQNAALNARLRAVEKVLRKKAGSARRRH